MGMAKFVFLCHKQFFLKRKIFPDAVFTFYQVCRQSSRLFGTWYNVGVRRMCVAVFCARPSKCHPSLCTLCLPHSPLACLCPDEISYCVYCVNDKNFYKIRRKFAVQPKRKECRKISKWKHWNWVWRWTCKEIEAFAFAVSSNSKSNLKWISLQKLLVRRMALGTWWMHLQQILDFRRGKHIGDKFGLQAYN